MRALLLLLALLPGWAMAGSVVAQRTLPAGTIIMPGDVAVSAEGAGGPTEIAHVVGQQLRVVVYEGRRIEAEGRALSAGSIGQIIRVMNTASRVTVSGRIAPDGTVVVQQF